MPRVRGPYRGGPGRTRLLGDRAYAAARPAGGGDGGRRMLAASQLRGRGRARSRNSSPGDRVVATPVVTDGERFRADEAWARALLAALPGAVHADISGADAPVADPAGKCSRCTGRTARPRSTRSRTSPRWSRPGGGLPFAAVRIILDPAWRRLPPAALVPLRADGTARPARGAAPRSGRTRRKCRTCCRIIADASLAGSTLARGRRLDRRRLRILARPRRRVQSYEDRRRGAGHFGPPPAAGAQLGRRGAAVRCG